MKKYKLQNKLLFINCCLFILVFASQFAFQNLFFDVYYKKRQTKLIDETLDSFKEAVDNNQLTKNGLLEISNKNKIILGYVDKELNSVAGNLFHDTDLTIETDDGKELVLYIEINMFNDSLLPIGGKVKAHVNRLDDGKLYVSSLEIMGEDGFRIQTIDEFITDQENKGESSNEIKPKDSFVVVGKLLRYTSFPNMAFEHQISIMNYIYSVKHKSSLDTESKVINFNSNKGRYLLTIRAVDTGYLIGSVSLEQSSEIINILNSFNLYIILFTLILVILVVMYFSKRIIIPIVKMKKGAQAIAEQDFSQPIEVRSRDELEELADALNSISDNLENKIMTLQSYNKQLKKEYEERLEIEQNQKNLLMNISHDLKTPLTVIKGYLKAIKDGVYDKDKYIDITIDSVDDISHTLSEMIELTKYRSKTYQLDEQEVDLTRLIYRMYNDLFYMSKEREQQVVLDVIDDVFVKVDEKAMRKVLENLLVNAIKYSPKGARINIRLMRVGNRHELTIENEGVFIDDKDLRHIFEAFYRVDKSRKESVQGNGLGLSIVKIILDYHQCLYHIKNTKKGVAFSISFNANLVIPY